MSASVLSNYRSWRLSVRTIVPFIVFGVFLSIGLTVYDDYGLSTDEGIRDQMGYLAYRFVFEGDRTLFEKKDSNLYHGVAYGVFLTLLAEDVFDFHDPYDIFLMRHAVNFLIFYASIIAFYLLCQQRFQNWKLSLLGSGMLFATPRIFAHGFYNPKDLPFLSFCLLCSYTLVLFLKKPTWPRAVIHAVFCAVALNFRVIGIILPGMTILFTLLSMLIWPDPEKNKSRGYSTGLYAGIFCVMVVLLTPTMWGNPIKWAIETLDMTRKFPWEGTVFYMGNVLEAGDIPWHYIPVWFLVTTPLLYIGLFFWGTISFCYSFLKKTSGYHRTVSQYQKMIDMLCFLLLFLPVGMVVLLKPVVYNGWRHLFFIYPFVVFFCLYGCWYGIILLRKKWGVKNKVGCMVLGVLGVLILFAEPVSFMIRYHPHQQLYFNRFAGRDMDIIKTRFDLDYWGLTYRAGLEYIVRHDQRKTIRVYTADWIGKYTGTHIFKQADRERLEFVNTPEEADYFIGNFYRHPEPYPYQHPFFSIAVNNADVLVVYEMENG